MMTWWLPIFTCLLLLTGCGGGPKANLMPPEARHTAESPDGDELLAEELSAKRLEELYARSGISGCDLALEEELRKWEHQVKFDVPIQMNRQVRAYLVYFATDRREVIRRYLARSTRYLPMIKEVFQEYGLPEDLAYLAMVESGFNPNAYSHAGACGMWQFIKGTGLRYGLIIDDAVDERRDPERSTRAAARYLSDLYRQFGSWYLAAASYNCGERRVQQQLSKSNLKNFWELSANRCLPTETKNYVPQMIAATIIAKNPEKFGFTDVPYQPPLMAGQPGATEPLRPIARNRRGSPDPGSKPVRTARVNLASLPAGGQACPPPVTRKSKNQATAASARKAGASAANGPPGAPAVYTASLFGSPSSGSNRVATRSHNAPRQSAAATKTGKTKKELVNKTRKKSPVRLAQARDQKRPRVATASKQKSSATSKKSKIAKTRPKAMLVSQAR